MEFQIRCLLCSVTLWWEGSEEEQWLLLVVLSWRKLSPNCCPDARHFSSSLYATGGFLAAIPVLRLRGNESKSMCEFFKGNCVGLQKFLPLIQSLLGFIARSYGDLPSWTWNPVLTGLLWSWDSSFPRCPSQNFIHLAWIWDQPIPCL